MKRTKFQSQDLKEKDSLEDPGVNWRMILEWILKRKRDDVAGWIHLAENENQWRVLVNMVMNLSDEESKTQTLWIKYKVLPKRR